MYNIQGRLSVSTGVICEGRGNSAMVVWGIDAPDNILGYIIYNQLHINSSSPPSSSGLGCRQTHRVPQTYSICLTYTSADSRSLVSMIGLISFALGFCSAPVALLHHQHDSLTFSGSMYPTHYSRLHKILAYITN